MLLMMLSLPVVVVAMLTAISPVIQTGLTSAFMWVANTGLGLIRDWSTTQKRIVLVAIGIVVSCVAVLIGGAVSPDTSTWSIATAQGLAQAFVSHFIFKIGKGK